MAGHEVAVAGTVRARYMVAVDWFMLSFEIQAFYFYSRGVKWRKQIWWLVMSSLLEKMKFTSCCFSMPGLEIFGFCFHRLSFS